MSLRDLQQKYGNTYIFYNKKIFFCQEFRDREDNDNYEVYGEIEGKDSNTWIPFDENKVTIQFPNTQYFTSQNQTWRFSRLPQRQWARGLCVQNTSWLNITKWLIDITDEFSPDAEPLRIGRYGDIPLCFESLKLLYTPQYPSILQAIETITLKCLVQALSENFYICPSIVHPEEFMIGSTCGFIGRLHPNERIITIHHDTVLQEFADMLNRTDQRNTWDLNRA